MFWYCERCDAWVPVLVLRTAWPDTPPGIGHTLTLCDRCQSSDVLQVGPADLEAAPPPVGLLRRVTVSTVGPAVGVGR